MMMNHIKMSKLDLFYDKINNLVFPFFGLLNLSISLKDWSSFLTNTGTNYVPVSLLKFIPVHTI